MSEQKPLDAQQPDNVAQEEKGNKVAPSCRQCSTLYYLPISLVVLAGYLIGLYGWYRCGIKPEVVELNNVSLYSALFALGLVGGAMSCSVFLVKDANLVMYGESAKPPNWVDVFGYTFQVIGGGFTGLMFYFVVRLGIDVATGNTSVTELTPEAGWLMAFSGGFATNRIKEFIVKLVTSKTSGRDDSGNSVQEKEGTK